MVAGAGYCTANAAGAATNLVRMPALLCYYPQPFVA